MTHPYAALPDRAFWRRGVVEAGDALAPVGEGFLRLAPSDRIATAGSCFAQHIGRALREAGFDHYVTEQAHPLLPPDVARAFGYGLFSARFGNLYTTTQLVQLVERAYGRFRPAEDGWTLPDGRLVDPFRPTATPGGYGSAAELAEDRARHLAAVRAMLEGLDVLVFTLGLTEGWVARTDGAAFPLCPGVAGGTFDPHAYAFRNLRAADVRAELGQAIAALRAVNPRARVLLTVSPVPLTATASGDHVLPATGYSKAALRCAAAEAAAELPGVWYFPSYEIITGPQARGRFFAPNLREVTPAGVATVMAAFLRAVGADAAPPPPPPTPAPAPAADPVAGWVEALCDEAMLDRPDPQG